MPAVMREAELLYIQRGLLSLLQEALQQATDGPPITRHLGNTIPHRVHEPCLPPPVR